MRRLTRGCSGPGFVRPATARVAIEASEGCAAAEPPSRWANRSRLESPEQGGSMEWVVLLLFLDFIDHNFWRRSLEKTLKARHEDLLARCDRLEAQLRGQE